MSKKIVGVTVGTPISPASLREKMQVVQTVNGVSPDKNGNVVVEGKDGESPTVSVTAISGGHKVSITDSKGTQTFNVMDGKDGSGGGTGGADGQDGYSPTVSVATITGGHRVTVEDVNGSRYFDVMDGTPGKDGTNGTNGKDGFAPSVSVSTITGGHTVTIKDAEGEHSFNVMDGEDGTGGSGDTIVESNNPAWIARNYPVGTLYFDKAGRNLYVNTNGATEWMMVKCNSGGGITDADREALINEVIAALPRYYGEVLV